MNLPDPPRADMLNLSVALQTLDYMSKEMDYGPLRVFARETDYMERMIERTELFADFQVHFPPSYLFQICKIYILVFVLNSKDEYRPWK